MTTLQKWLLHVSFALLVVSGVGFAVMKYLMVSEDPYSAVGHPLQPWALSLHVLAGPLAIFAVGFIFREHILGRRRQRNGNGKLGSGLFAAGLLLPMIASGYLLEVVTHPLGKQILVVTHLVSGGLYVVCYAVHIIQSMRRASIVAALAVAISVGTTSSASAPCDGVERARMVMGSLARVVVCTPGDEAEAAASASAALDAFDRVDRVMSLYKPGSDLSRLNRDGHAGPVVVAPELLRLLAISRELTKETDGAFDVTIKPLMDHYGFYRELGFAAPAGGLAGALALVGGRDLVIDSAGISVRFPRAGMGVDLGGIAKGFTLDEAAAVLRQRGVRRAFLDLGRNLMFVGEGPARGGRWPASIADPIAPDGIASCIEVPEGSLSTSSTSGRTILLEGGSGKSVGHILDPSRGAVEGRIRQSTVWSPSATRADALSTAALLLDPKVTRRILARLGEAAILYRPSRGTRSRVLSTTIGFLSPAACNP